MNQRAYEAKNMLNQILNDVYNEIRKTNQIQQPDAYITDSYGQTHLVRQHNHSQNYTNNPDNYKMDMFVHHIVEAAIEEIARQLKQDLIEKVNK